MTLLVSNGRAMIIMANQFPHSKFTGYEISKEAIQNAQSQSLTYDNKNVEFDVKDVSIF
ncbi:MAG: methyltransferase domain-containing protein [Nitrososphaeraceae archaeon]